MDASTVRALGTAEGSALLDRVAAAGAVDPLALGEALRRDHHPDLVAAATTLVDLRRHAVGKLGDDAAAMVMDRTGLEQATRATVARHRADRLAASGARTVVDLGCGIGADLIALRPRRAGGDRRRPRPGPGGDGAGQPVGTGTARPGAGGRRDDRRPVRLRRGLRRPGPPGRRRAHVRPARVVTALDVRPAAARRGRARGGQDRARSSARADPGPRRGGVGQRRRRPRRDRAVEPAAGRVPAARHPAARRSHAHRRRRPRPAAGRADARAPVRARRRGDPGRPGHRGRRPGGRRAGGHPPGLRHVRRAGRDPVRPGVHASWRRCPTGRGRCGPSCGAATSGA